MKFLIILLLFILFLWYYRKRKLEKLVKKKVLEVEMRACDNCGVFFSAKEPLATKEETKILFFCSEKCYREYLDKEKVK